uniref:Uncharacterized protein n=1 Tax=Tanacetum cinerariifolium TaxID=118510 RepID=A0A6L2L4U9_TANCI|nr:hypothetical protein [Tanacetum cinerariifolium]
MASRSFGGPQAELLIDVVMDVDVGCSDDVVVMVWGYCIVLIISHNFPSSMLSTVDAPEINMPHFWHTATYDLTTKTYFFTLDDQIFEVNVDLLREALQITPKVSDHPFVEPPPENEIISFIKKLGYSGPLTKVSNMAINNLYQPWRTFMTMIDVSLSVDHGFIGYLFDDRVILGFDSIMGGLDSVNHVIRLPLEHEISSVLGKDDYSNPSVGTNHVTAFIT